MNKQYYVIATLRDGDKIVGYRILDVTVARPVDIAIENIEKIAPQIFNVVYDKTFKGLVSTVEPSIQSMPVIGKDMLCEGNSALAVVQIVIDSKGNQIGAVVIDTMGVRANVTLETLDSLCKRAKPVNFKLTSSLGRYKLSPIGEGAFLSRELDTYKRSSYRETDAVKNTDTDFEVQKVPVYALSKVTSSSFNKKANELMFEAISGLKQLSPYYYVLLQTIDKRPCNGDVVETMGVTEDKLYYNVAFVVTLTVAELRFILIHEVMHIAMMHAARHGKRDHKLWNIATDLYINEMIVHDFDLIPGVVSKVNGVEITPPTFALYFTMINEVCNLSKDIPELIYRRLEEENKNNSDSNGNSNGSKDSGENKDSNGNNKDQNSSDSNTDGQSGGTGNSNSSITYNGKELVGSAVDDIMSNTGRGTDDAKEESDNQARQKLSDMKTKKKMVEEKIGQELTKGLDYAQLVQRMIDFNLESTLDWRKVLKNIALEKPKKKYTLASPNEAYMNMGVTLADRRRIGKPDKLKNIKICIDVSGSVCDDVLSRFLSEVAHIYDRYQIDGELIYWNTDVCDSGLFSNRNQLTKVKSDWSGGTDVSCLFKWLSGGTKSITGKVEKTKVRDIKAIIIITDGCFSSNYEEYEEAFGKKTLWLIDGYGATFNPCFGKVMSLGKENL